MFSRSLLARCSPLRLSATLTTRTCLRSLSTLHFARSARCAALPSSANLRRFSVAPAFRTEGQDNQRTSYPPSGTCYVANLPYKVTAEQLKEAFSELAKVATVHLVTTEAGMSRGIAFVQFESVAEAVKFVDAHMADPIFVLDRQLFVEHAQRSVVGRAEPSDTLVVLKFQGESTAGVRDMFGSYVKDILYVRFDKKEDGRASRKAFVQFRDVDMASEAMKAFKDRYEDIQIVYARQRQPPADAQSLTSRLSQFRDH